MITPDDPRHGTTRGFHAECRKPCCRTAYARYEKAGRLARLHGGVIVPALGYQRRIQALMRLGWTATDIAREAGWGHRNYVYRVVKGQKGRPCRYLLRDTAATLSTVYERLAMRLPDMTPQRARTQALAERNGWPPPLAWDDIDDPDEEPRGLPSEPTCRRSEGREEHLRDAIDRGDTLARVTTDLGITADGLWRWCRRNGHSDLWRALSERSAA